MIKSTVAPIPLFWRLRYVFLLACQPVFLFYRHLVTAFMCYWVGVE